MILALLWFLAVPHGTYRWPVKTLSDGFRPAAAETASIATLSRWRAPTVTKTLPRTRAERTLVVIRGVFVLERHEKDGDLHLVVRDGGQTMICEVPDPRNMPAAYRKQVSAARRFATALKPGQRLVVTGVAYFDKLHDASGAAANGIELHPVLRIQRGRSNE